MNVFAEPLLKKKAQTDQIRLVLNLFGKFNFLLEIPNKLRIYLLQKDPKSFSRIYQKNSSYLKNFAKLPILSKITEDVAQIINSMQGTLLEMISLKPKKFENINDIIQILFSLNFLPNPLEFLLENLILKLLNRVEKVFSRHIFENKTLNKENINKRNSIIRKKMTKNDDDDEEKNEKNIEDFFNDEGDLLNKFMKSNSINEDSLNLTYNSKKFEEFSNELIINLENLFILLKNYREGNYDYHFKDMKSNELRDMEANVLFTFFNFKGTYFIFS